MPNAFVVTLRIPVSVSLANPIAGELFDPSDTSTVPEKVAVPVSVILRI